MQFIDTHAHLYDPAYATDRAYMIERMIQVGISKILLPNIDIGTIEPMLQLESQYPQLFASMIGIHPCYVQENTLKQLYQIEDWLNKHPFIAIGEVGIDLYEARGKYQDLQQEVFEIQVGWAKQHQLPLSIHTRHALQETIKILEKHQNGGLTGVFHCFGGTIAEAEQIINLGFHLGIGGVITFKNSTLSQVVAHIPLEQLVLETDSPYLAPVPYRGKQNEPTYLPYIAAEIAKSHQTDIQTVAAITTANAKKIFKIV
eukprot:gene229-306_t